MRPTTTILKAIEYLTGSINTKEIQLSGFEKQDTLLDKFEECHTIAFIQRDSMVDIS